MDAAQLTRKIALYFAGALLMAGAASAQTLVVSPNTVTFRPFAQQFTLNVTSSTATQINFTVGATQPWYTVVASGNTTPATLTVTRILENCGQSNTCTTFFNVTNNANSADVARVDVAVDATSGGTSILSSNLNPINLSAVAGTSTFALPSILTTSATAVGVTITQNPGLGQWLTVTPQSGTVVQGSPLQLTVTANSFGLGNNQTYTGSITIAPNNGAAPLTIPVNFNVGTGNITGSLIPNPTFINFGYPSGNTSQFLTVTSNSATSFNAAANSSNGWLVVQTGAFFVGNSILVSVNAAAASGLPTGIYNGQITLTSNLGDITVIPVTLSVNGATGGGGTVVGGIAPSTLNFQSVQFGAAPVCQRVLLPYTGSFVITPTGSPLFIYTSTAEIAAPAEVLVCAATAGLAPGTYQNALNIVSASLGISQSIVVNLTVYTAPIVTAAVNNTNGVVLCFFNTGAQACNDATLEVRMSDGSSAAVTVASSAAWVTIEGGSGTTPTTYTVRLNPSALSNGVNSATITVSGTGSANGSVVVPVVVQVNGGTSSGGGNLTFSASSLSFTAAGSQQLNVNSAAATNFTVSTPSTGCGWLSISPSGALTTPQNLTVSATSAGLNPGQQLSCNITFVAGGITQTVAVNFNVPSGPQGNITVTPTSLAFATQTGVNPASQTLSVTSSAANVPYTVATQSSGWLSVAQANGTTPGTVTVQVNAANLANGVHPGQIIISPNGGQAVQINVNLTVSPATTVSATPTTLTFSYIAGNPNPPAQVLQVTGNGPNLNYTATVTAGNEWLSVTPASGTTPASPQVRVTPGALNPGTHTGTIVVAGAAGATGSTTITVTLTVTAPLPTIERVTNAASFNTGPISAGEIITLFGVGMGPATIVAVPANTTQFPTTLGGVQVTVAGYPAPLIYVRGDQIAAIVPYEINRPFIANATVIVRYLGQTSNGVSISQSGAALGVFTVGGGSGQGAILNQNLSVNSAGNPANKGDVVVLYVTGEGVTNPAGVTGRVTPPTAPFPQPATGAVTVTIDGQPATVEFYGSAPNLVAGVMQVNVRLSPNARSGDLPIVVMVGNFTSQLDARGVGAVTVAVR
jgi:uncharacterized protein (TIGR03437 family)